MNIKKFWDEGINYEQYLQLAQEHIDNPNTDPEYLEYFKLGLMRMNRMMKSFNATDEQNALLEQKQFKGKILIITEPWCGDASNAVPVVQKFFNNNEMRITLRDQEPSLIDHFLTNGGKSIPIVIFLNENFEVINSWGPRPAYGLELFKKFKANPETYDKGKFHNELQVYYAKNKGQDTINEILDLL